MMKNSLYLVIMFLWMLNLSSQEDCRKSGKPMEIDLMSNLQLDQTGFQFLMSSQNYESNYAVYVQLFTSEVKGNPNKRKLDRADFKLINYKSRLFLDIVHVALEKINFNNLRLGELQRSIPNIESCDVEAYKFKVFVQAKSYDTSCVKTLIPKDETVLNKKKVLISERYLVPMFAEKINEVPTDCPSDSCLFNSYSKELGMFRIRPHNFFIVDTEFFYMDGLGHIVRREDYEEYATDALSKDELETLENDGKLPGPRCKTGLNIIL